MTWQVASLVVQCRPMHQPMIEATFAAVPGIAVVGTGNGRLVVLIEGTSESALAERFDAVRSHPNVLSAALVAHHLDSPTTNEPTAEVTP